MHCVNITMTDLSSYKTFNKLTLKLLMHKNANAEKKIGLKYIQSESLIFFLTKDSVYFSILLDYQNAKIKD